MTKKYFTKKSEEIYEIFKPMCTNFWCKEDIIEILKKIAIDQRKECIKKLKTIPASAKFYDDGEWAGNDYIRKDHAIECLTDKKGVKDE